MNSNYIPIAISIVTALSLGACATGNGPDNYHPEYERHNMASSRQPAYGVVQSVELIRLEGTDSGMGVGTIAGAVIGGIVGNQVGAGRGNTAATVVGAAGGAYAGHQMEKRNQSSSEAYKFQIRMDDGSHQTVTQTTNPDIRVGDRVQIDNGVIRRY